jgi:hypothetical protein
LLVGKGNEVDMVGHQAIGPDFQPILLGIFSQPGKILQPVPGFKENVLPVITPLGDVVEHPGKNAPGLAAHNGGNISKKAAPAKKNGVCPLFGLKPLFYGWS